MNPKSNLALAPEQSKTDTLMLHSQELRHLGTLRRFKRVCDEMQVFEHTSDRLRFDIAYRDRLLSAVAASDDMALRAWLAPVSEALSALDVINEHLKSAGERLRLATVPGGFSDSRPQTQKQRAAHAKNRRHWPIALVLLLLLAVAIAAALFWPRGSLTPAKPVAPAALEAAPPVFRMHGSNTIGEALAPALFNAYIRKKNGELGEVRSDKPLERLLTFRSEAGGALQALELHAHGSGTAYGSLKTGMADIGMSSRPIKDSENDELTPLFGDMRAVGTEHVIGLDGLAVIVHPSNQIEKLTVQQVAGIFSGKYSNWQELGGANLPIALHARDDKSGTWDSFKTMVLDRHKLSLNPASKRYESSNELSDQVAANAGAIGFIGLPYVRQARAVPVADTETSMAFLPTFFTVSTEDYPLARRLFLYAPAQKLNPQAREFIEFTLSDAGQDVVRQAGFVPQVISRESVSSPAGAPYEYAQMTRAAQRLSITLRFRSGSNELDSKATRDVGRLLAYLSQHPSQSVHLLGFTDAVGSIQKNAQLSKSRADSVARMLNSSGITPKQVLGLGGNLPVASNEDELGRNRNRRVEVWLGS